MFKLSNPLPQALRDTENLAEFYRGYNLVPYAGNTRYSGHSFLKILCDMYELSPSHANCIDDIRVWAFEGQLDVVRHRPGGRTEEVSEVEKDQFFEFLQSLGIDDQKVIDVTDQLFLNWKKTGTAYLHYREVTVGGTLRIFLDVLDTLNVMFLNTPKGEPRSVVISSDFFSGKFTDDPRLVRVYPSFTEGGQDRETVFVFKNKRDHSDWYGRPDSLQTLFWQFTEWSICNLTAKISNSETTAKVMLAMERPDPNTIKKDDNPEEAFEKMSLHLRQLTTNRGDFDSSESLGVVGYPYGSKEPKAIKLEIPRDKDYMESVVGKASDYIYATHGWSKVLNGFERPKSNIGGNVLIDEFMSRNTSTIKPNQRRWERHLQKVYQVISERAEQPQFSDMCHRFEDKVESLVESMKDGKDAANEIGSQEIDTGRDESARSTVQPG